MNLRSVHCNYFSDGELGEEKEFVVEQEHSVVFVVGMGDCGGEGYIAYDLVQTTALKHDGGKSQHLTHLS